jgi:orotate phosphoribosyltransferase
LASTLSLPGPLQVHRGDPRVVQELLAFPDALLSGHFRLLSGLHTDRFLAFSRIAGDPTALKVITDLLLPEVAAQSPSIVVAPSTAGVGLGWALAQRLGIPLHLATLNADGRAEGILGEPDIIDQRVLLVNDVLTTGTGFKLLADQVRGRGADLAAAAWFLTRASVDLEALLHTPAFPVVTLPLASWAAADCRLCASKLPLRPALDLN